VVKWIRTLFVIGLLSGSFVLTLSAITADSMEGIIDVPSNYPYIETRMLESSRHTQTEDVDQAVLDAYEATFTLSFSDADLETLGFEKMVDNDQIALWFEPLSFSMMVRNKETGYLWSSRPEFQGISGEREDNTSNRNLMNSGFWVTYGRKANITSATIVTESLFTIADVEYETNGAITAEQNDPTGPYRIVEDSYKTVRVQTSVDNRTATGFDVDVNIRHLGFRMTVTFDVQGGSVSATIDNTTIEESTDIYALLSVTLFPYMGATREDKVPGYVVIPDGVGALVRLNARHNTRFQSRFYGPDAGYQSRTLPYLSVPIYGMVHRSGADAYYAEIEEGSEQSQLIAQFWGDNSRYHRIASRFSVRDIFRTVINKAGDGRDAVTDTMTSSDYSISYRFLSGDDASYVGIAKDYRDRLRDQGVLTDGEETPTGQIPLHTSYITGDREPAFFGTAHVSMTMPEEMSASYRTFMDAGITNQQVGIYGWSRDGFVFRAPYRTRLRDASGFETLFEEITADGNTVYLENAYIRTTELSSRVSYNRDVARNLSRLKMSSTRRDLNGNALDHYHLIPESSYRMASDDVSFFKDLGITGLMSAELGNTLFSTYDDGVVTERAYGMETYLEIAALHDAWLMSAPSAYMFAALGAYMDMPVTNSQFDYYTDLVPLLPIILKGSVPAFTPYLNFNALGDERILMMVDFALNPAYVLTEKPTYEMRYTNASLFYTTEFALYKYDIISTYDRLNGALAPVIGAMVESREIPVTGLSVVTYDNGVTIYVNYTQNALTHDGITVAARSWEVRP
jgi:hypothetical protein